MHFSAARCLPLCFFNDTATTEIYTLSLHDALPIYTGANHHLFQSQPLCRQGQFVSDVRSEEHTSELQSLRHLVCPLLLQKKVLTWTAPRPGGCLRECRRALRYRAVG